MARAYETPNIFCTNYQCNNINELLNADEEEITTVKKQLKFEGKDKIVKTVESDCCLNLEDCSETLKLIKKEMEIFESEDPND